MIALTGPAAANVKLASHCVIRSHRFYSKMNTSVGIQMCLILLTCNSLEQLLCNRMKRCHRLNLEFVADLTVYWLKRLAEISRSYLARENPEGECFAVY